MEFRDISRMLYEEWDPLGVRARAPEDEYDDYAKEILHFLQEQKSEDYIHGYLSEVRAKKLLMAPDQTQDRKVAKAIILMNKRGWR